MTTLHQSMIFDEKNETLTSEEKNNTLTINEVTNYVNEIDNIYYTINNFYTQLYGVTINEFITKSDDFYNPIIHNKCIYIKINKMHTHYSHKHYLDAAIDDAIKYNNLIYIITKK